MIYLIGGTPRSGKTTVAKKLANSLKTSWISADTLEGISKHFTPLKEHGMKFPKNVLRKNTKNSNDLMYSKYSAEQIMRAYIQQAKSSWKVLEVLVDYLVGEDYDFVIEGHQIAPELVSRIQKKHGKNIKSIFLLRHDVNTIVEDGKKSTHPNDWFIKKTANPETYSKIAIMISKYGDYLKKEAQKNKFKFLNMDSDFINQILKSIKAIKS